MKEICWVVLTWVEFFGLFLAMPILMGCQVDLWLHLCGSAIAAGPATIGAVALANYLERRWPWG